ncbi:MAG: DUF2442 domain-containing protein [Pseudomonadota bacterium]
MNISINDVKIKDVLFAKENMTVFISDGRSLTVPLDWFPRLANASKEALISWELSAAGHGIHWEKLDEDISLNGLLYGKNSLHLTQDNRI